ncbi:MAG: hypothetical protein IJR40_00775 [Treponema sp.]|nr:hypothetical protein [Treponema sp.]
MQNDLFTINYQKQFIATPKSEIFFFEGTPDLKKLFFSTEAKTEASTDAEKPLEKTIMVLQPTTRAEGAFL